MLYIGPQWKDKNSPKTRGQNLLSHQYPEHRLLLPSSRGTLSHVQLPGSSGWTAQVQGPSLYNLKTFWCDQVLGFGTFPGMLEDQDKGGHQHQWTHTALLLARDRAQVHCLAWLTPSHTQAASQQCNKHCCGWHSQGPQGNLHLPSAAERLEVTLQQKRTSADQVSLWTLDTLLCFHFLLKYQVFYTSIEIYF